MISPIDNDAGSSRLNKVQKLACFLLMIGPDSAAQVMRHLDEAEIEAVASEMTKLNLVPMEVQNEILREMSEVAVQASTSLRGGADYAQAVLEKAIGIGKATHVIQRVAPTRMPVPALQTLIEMESRQLCNLLKEEQPQTIALVISYLSPQKASVLLKMFPAELRTQVVERMATLSATPVEVMERVIKVITQRLTVKPARALNQSGGVKSAADLLNALDKELTKDILKQLEEKNPQLGIAIRQKMFTFEDLAQLDAATLQKVLREVDMRDLAISLKTASEHLKGALLGAISKRAAETVAEEMSFLGSLKLKEIESSQLRIIEQVRKLESEGEIDLSSLHEPADAIAA